MGGAGMIRLEQVTKGYDGKCVINRLNWQIGKGERWRITGASGAGKTTLLRLLMGLELPDSGYVIGAEQLRFCPVFQEDRLTGHWSALQNVALVCEEGSRVRDILSALLSSDALNQPVFKLSGGMRRRAALARALAADGDILILDEPFTGLDEQTALRAWNTVLRYQEGRTLILVSHGISLSDEEMHIIAL